MGAELTVENRLGSIGCGLSTVTGPWPCRIGSVGASGVGEWGHRRELLP